MPRVWQYAGGRPRTGGGVFRPDCMPAAGVIRHEVKMPLITERSRVLEVYAAAAARSLSFLLGRLPLTPP